MWDLEVLKSLKATVQKGQSLFEPNIVWAQFDGRNVLSIFKNDPDTLDYILNMLQQQEEF